MKIAKKILLIMLIALIPAFLLEVGYYNFRAIRDRENPTIELAENNGEFVFTGFRKEGSSYISETSDAHITFEIPNQYFNRIKIDYTSPQDGSLVLSVGTFDGDGTPVETDHRDSIDHRLDQSVTLFDSSIASGKVSVQCEGIEIRNVILSREFSFNGYRFALFALAFSVAASLFVFRELFGKKPEWSFLLIAIAAGSIMLVLMPLKHPVVWDDDVHFRNVYELSYGRDVMWTDAALEYNRRNAPAANTIEERILSAEYMNEKHDYDEIAVTDPGKSYIAPQSRSYVPMAIFLLIGRFLKTDFFTLQLLGRTGNLLFYIAVVFFAIRNMPAGKRLVSVLALMPTPLFMACNYSYDPFIISLSFLGFSFFMKEFARADKLLSIGNIIGMVLAFVLASFSKAVYIPIMLMLFLFGEKKFSSGKQMRLFRLCVLLIIIVVLLSFVLPIAGSSVEGDSRGGDTSVSEQLTYITQHPIIYSRLLLRSIWFSLGEYIAGPISLFNFAYLGTVSGNAFYVGIALLIFLLMTDRYNDDGTFFRPKQKLFVSVILFGIVCLIWTAIYMSFTPVGLNRIIGVQARYYIPIMLPLLYLLRNRKIENRFSEKNYHLAVMLASTFVIFSAVYYLLLKPFTF